MKKYDINAKKLNYSDLFQYTNGNADPKRLATVIQSHFENFKTTKDVTFESESGYFSYKECEKITKSFNSVLESEYWGKILTELLEPKFEKSSIDGYNYVDKTGNISIAVVTDSNIDMLHEAYMGTFINNSRKYLSNFPYTFYFVEGGAPKIDSKNLTFDFDDKKRVYYIFKQRIPNAIRLSLYLDKISSKDYAERSMIASSINLQYKSCENLMNILFKNFTIEETLNNLYVNTLPNNIDIPYYETIEEETSGYLGFWKSKKSVQKANKFINTNVVLDIVDYKNSSIIIDSDYNDIVISNSQKENQSDIGILVMEKLNVNIEDSENALYNDRNSKVAFCNNDIENYTCKRLFYPCDFVEDELKCLVNNINLIVEDPKVDRASIIKKLKMTNRIIFGMTLNVINYFKISYLLNVVSNDFNIYKTNINNQDIVLEKEMKKLDTKFSALVNNLSEQEQTLIRCRMCIFKEYFLIQRYLRVYSFYYNDNSLYTKVYYFLQNEDYIHDIEISVNKDRNPFYIDNDPATGVYEEEHRFIALILAGINEYISIDDFIKDYQTDLIEYTYSNFRDAGDLRKYPKGKLKYLDDLVIAVNPTDVLDIIYKIIKYVSSEETSVLELDNNSIIPTIKNVEL